ncbi:MAG: C13 family peptidase [Gemmatimonadetes bacterium]|nr:C13 family peptidase [Gemmatimonadota bacterium]
MRGARTLPAPRAYTLAVVGGALGAMLAAMPAAAQQATHVLIVTGLGGDPAYSERINRWGTRMYDAAVERFAVPRDQVVWLAEKPDIDPARVSGASTKDGISAAIERIAGKAGASDVVFILLFGHGSFQSGQSRFSVPGPDPTAQDFAVLLDRLGAARVVLVNTASASGEFLRVLSGPGRIIVTATRSGNERNATLFGGHFVEAFASDVADTDKDGAVSLLEAFTYARTSTEREYASDQRLPTEHAVLDDDGDQKGSSDMTDQGDGRIARATFIGQAAVTAGVAAPANASPALRALYEERQKIERAIEQLKAVKDSMDPVRYEAELERLLVELALKNQEIRRMEGDA